MPQMLVRSARHYSITGTCSLLQSIARSGKSKRPRKASARLERMRNLPGSSQITAGERAPKRDHLSRGSGQKALKYTGHHVFFTRHLVFVQARQHSRIKRFGDKV